MTTLLNQKLIGDSTDFGRSLLSAADAGAARTLLGVTAVVLPSTHMDIGYANNATDATNDIDFTSGSCCDSTKAVNIVLAGLTKRLDAEWTVGTNQGGREAGSTLADGWWHWHAIYRSDTSVADVMFSASITPTLPANYTHFRYGGSIYRVAGAIKAFRQRDDVVKWVAPVTDFSNTAAVASGLLALTVPPGRRVYPYLNADMLMATAGNAIQLMDDGDAPDTSNASSIVRSNITDQNVTTAIAGLFRTNAASQVRFEQLLISGTLTSSRVFTTGWRDPRGI